MWYHSPKMPERQNFEIQEIGRDFFIKGPVEVACQPRGFNRWCRLPYPGHPNGCPNFGKKDSCPPLTPYFLDIYKPHVFVAFMQFDFKEYLETKISLHSDWTERQLRNPWYFQSHLDSQLKHFVDSQLGQPGFSRTDGRGHDARASRTDHRIGIFGDDEGD